MRILVIADRPLQSPLRKTDSLTAECVQWSGVAREAWLDNYVAVIGLIPETVSESNHEWDAFMRLSSKLAEDWNTHSRFTLLWGDLRAHPDLGALTFPPSVIYYHQMNGLFESADSLDTVLERFSPTMATLSVNSTIDCPQIPDDPPKDWYDCLWELLIAVAATDEEECAWDTANYNDHLTVIRFIIRGQILSTDDPTTDTSAWHALCELTAHLIRGRHKDSNHRFPPALPADLDQFASCLVSPRIYVATMLTVLLSLPPSRPAISICDGGFALEFSFGPLKLGGLAAEYLTYPGDIEDSWCRAWEQYLESHRDNMQVKTGNDVTRVFFSSDLTAPTKR